MTSSSLYHRLLQERLWKSLNRRLFSLYPGKSQHAFGYSSCQPPTASHPQGLILDMGANQLGGPVIFQRSLDILLRTSSITLLQGSKILILQITLPSIVRHPTAWCFSSPQVSFLKTFQPPSPSSSLSKCLDSSSHRPDTTETGTPGRVRPSAVDCGGVQRCWKRPKADQAERKWSRI